MFIRDKPLEGQGPGYQIVLWRSTVIKILLWQPFKGEGGYRRSISEPTAEMLTTKQLNVVDNNSGRQQFFSICHICDPQQGHLIAAGVDNSKAKKSN